MGFRRGFWFLLFFGLSISSYGMNKLYLKPVTMMGYEMIKPIYRVQVKIQKASYKITKPNYDKIQINPKIAINEGKNVFNEGYKNIVNIKDKFLVKNINYLYEMGYLPFRVSSYDGEKATLTWYASKVPPKLVALSITNSHSILYRSAIQRFMRDYNISFNINNTSYAYNVLKKAYEQGFKAKKPFLWVYVDQHIPQRLYVWENGKFVFTSPVNTGVMGTTNVGTYMIYLRLRKTVMKGFFPGTNNYYEDKDVPWVNYFYQGEGIHGFPRYRYGYPQSAGCVEMPISKARELYSMLYKYALVTLSHYDARYLATHPYKHAPKFKPINPLKLVLQE